MISDQENDPKIAPTIELVLPPLELGKISVGFYVNYDVFMQKNGEHEMSLYQEKGKSYIRFLYKKYTKVTY